MVDNKTLTFGGLWDDKILLDDLIVQARQDKGECETICIWRTRVYKKIFCFLLWPLSMSIIWLGGQGIFPLWASYAAIGILLLHPLLRGGGFNFLPTWKSCLDFPLLLVVVLSTSLAFLMAIPMENYTLPENSILFKLLTWKSSHPSISLVSFLLVGFVNSFATFWLVGSIKPLPSLEELERQQSVKQSKTIRAKLLKKVNIQPFPPPRPTI